MIKKAKGGCSENNLLEGREFFAMIKEPDDDDSIEVGSTGE